MSWQDVAQSLNAALDELAAAQDTMDEMDVPHISENLTQYVEGVRRFRDLAEEKALQ